MNMSMNVDDVMKKATTRAEEARKSKRDAEIAVRRGFGSDSSQKR